MTVTLHKTYTHTEYFSLEESTRLRYSYCNGEVFEMPGGTPNHNQLALSLIAFLMKELKGQPYKIFSGDLRLWVDQLDTYTYPDVMVIPKPIEFKLGRKDTVMNPILIAEVLSDSTKEYDRSEKFAAYRTIPNFQEFLLIDQYQPKVEHYLRQGKNQWLLSEYSSLEERLLLSSLQTEISLLDLYENIEF